MPSSPVRVRHAASPTGDFHVGGARTALFNYLFARHHGGSFLPRIEDTDQKRYNPQALTWLMRGLRYLGLDWDEGPEAGGAYGPYTQTERLEIYRRYRDQLLDAGFAYRCFCTSERLETASKERQQEGLNPGYDRFCRNLDPAEAARRAAALPLCFQLLAAAGAPAHSGGPEAKCDSVHPLWLCPQCAGPMLLLELLSPLQARLRSPPATSELHA